MTTLYLISLLVGGFFVLLSLFGGGDSDVDTDFDADLDADFDADVDADADMAVDSDAGAADTGLVDLFSIRAVFLFATFFGLTGMALSLAGTGEPFTLILAALVGILVGLGGNYLIKRVGYQQISSDVPARELKGMTGKVLVPFKGKRRGKINLVARGHSFNLVARAFENQTLDVFQPGDEVVVIRVDGSVVEVVKPE